MYILYGGYVKLLDSGTASHSSLYYAIKKWLKYMVSIA